MNDPEPLLYPLFEHLRRADVPLGVEEYLLAVRLLREGRGLDDPDALRSLCRSLWAKSREDQDQFDYAFARFVEPRLRPRPAADGKKPPPPKPDDPRGEVKQQRSERLPVAEPEADPEEGAVTAEMLRVPVGSVAPAAETPRAAGAWQLTPRPPLGLREMTGVWRQLRRPRRSGPAVELDVPETITRIAKTGYLLRPVLRPRRTNQAQLLVLLDRGTSMDPFAPVVGALVTAIRRAGLLAADRVCWFRDCPVGSLTTERGRVPLARVLAEKAVGASVVVVSDAGAAGGTYSEDRATDIQAFLKELAARTYLTAWVNPFPEQRWVDTTALAVARMVPMFPLTREGLIDCVDVLRGHPFSPGVRPDAGP